MTINTYSQALGYLMTKTNYERMAVVRYNGTTFDLSRMQRLASRLGNPHKKLKCVHIAGTKGKGSTAMMLARMLEQVGYRVGLYLSPHVYNIRERICINTEMISEKDFAGRVSDVAKAAAKMPDGQVPTFFELMTAMAMVHFLKKKVDLAIFETGLGGRLDSTNIITPLVSAMTSISRDHTRQLGTSLTKISEEKAGIFKPDIPAISAPQTTEVKRALRRMANKIGAPLRFCGDEIDFSIRLESSREMGTHNRICLGTKSSRFEHFHVPLPGAHQSVNCGLALALFDPLKDAGFEIDDDEAIRGLNHLYLPGRMEMVCPEPRVLADGAHNEASIDVLMRALGQNIPYDSLVVVFGCAQDKDVDAMLRRIATAADKVIFTRIDHPRSAEPEDLIARYDELTGKMCQSSDTLAGALQIALTAAAHEDLVCVMGSFYLVGEVRKVLKKLGVG